MWLPYILRAPSLSLSPSLLISAPSLNVLQLIDCFILRSVWTMESETTGQEQGLLCYGLGAKKKKKKEMRMCKL